MPTIDNKIVQMNFENKQFERGVKESLHSLEELKKALDLDKSAQSLQNLERAAERFDISGIAKGVDSIADRFSLLGNIGQEIFHRISKTAVDAMQNVVHTITAMPQAGLSKYESKNKAVQMIQGALPEKSVAEIEEVLSRLNAYTDATSYDFSSMAQNIGKFTAAGVDLDVAERAMEGIANETASAGGEIWQANIAMNNFSQALAAGAMKLNDWKSLEYQNLATEEFKETIIDTAIELGVLRKAGTHTGTLLKKTSKGVQKINVNATNLRETLNEGWFNNSVMIKVLETYADRESEVGKKGFEMAKVAITLTQAFEAVKDAISTNWMKTWEYVFGDLEEASALFTRISDALIDFTDKIGSFRNSILEGWHTGGEDGVSGYTMAIEALSNAWQTLMGIAEAGSRAVTDVFGMIDSSGLIAMTQSLRDFTQGLRDFFGYSEETVTHTKAVWEVVEGIPKWTHEIKKGMKGVDVENLQKRLLWLKNDLIRLDKFGADGIFGPETQAALKAFQKEYGLSVTGIYDQQTRDALEKALHPNGKRVKVVKEYEETITHIGTGLELVQKAFSGVLSVAKAGLGIVKMGLTIAGRIGKMLIPVAKGALTLVAGIGDALTYVVDFFTTLIDGETALAGFDAFLSPISSALSTIGGVLDSVGDGISKLVALARGATDFESLGEMLNLDPETNKNALWIYNILKGIRNVIEQVRPSVEKIVNALSSFFETVRVWVGDKITAGLEAIGNFFTNLWNQAEEGNVLQKVLDGVATGLQLILGIIAGVGYGIYTIGKSIVDGAVAVYEFIKNSELLKNIMSTLSTFFAPVGNFFKAIWDGLTKIRTLIPSFKSFSEFWSSLMHELMHNPLGVNLIEPLTKIKNVIATPIRKIKEFADGVRAAFQAISQYGGTENALTELMKDPEKNKGAINTIKFLQKVQDLFAKIRAFLGSVRQTISNVFGKISPALKEFGTAAWDSIKNFFGGDGTSATDKIGGWFNTIKTTFRAYWDTFSKWVSEVVRNSPFLSAIREFGGLVAKAFSDFFSMDTSGAANAGEAIAMRLAAFNPVIDWIKEKYGILKDALTGEGSLLDKIKKFFSIDEGSVLGSIISGAKGLAQWVGGFDLDTIWGGIKKAFNIFILTTIVRTLSRFSKSLAVLTGAQSKQDDKGKLVLELAISIGIIAGALALLAKTDATEALKGVGVMTLALAAISGALIALNYLAPNIKGIGSGILMLSASIGLVLLSVVGAMKLLEDNPPEKLTPALIFVGSILGVLSVLAVAIGRFSKAGGSLGGAAVVAALCLGLNMVVRAIGKLSTMFKEAGDDSGYLDKALWWMVGLIAALGAVSIGISRWGKTGGSIGGALMMLAFCVALNSVVRAIGSMINLMKKYPDNFDKAFEKVEIILLTLGGMVTLLGIFGKNWGSVLAATVPIVAIGFVMQLIISTMADAIKSISGVDPSIVISFMEGVRDVLLILAGAVVAFSMIPVSGFLSASVGFVAIMAAIGVGIDIAASFVADAMKKMATALWLVGSRLADFSDFMTRVDTSTIKSALDCLIDNVLPAIQKIVGYSSVIQSGVEAAKNVWLFGVAIGLFSDSISGITEQTGAGIKQLATDIQETVNTINSIQGVDAAKDVLESLGAALGLYFGNLKTISVDANGEATETGGNFDIAKANEAFQNLADLTLDDATIKKIQSYAKDGDNDLNSFAEGIQNLGVALKNYGENVGTLDSTDIEKANDVLGMGLAIQAALDAANGINFVLFKGKRKTLTDFGLDIAALGGALKSYGDSIEGLNKGKITLAKFTMEAMSEIAGKLPETGGIVQFVTGTKDLGEFAANMSALGDGMAAFAKKVSGSDFTNVDASLAPIRALAEVQNTLGNTGGLMDWLKGTANLSDLGTGLNGLGDGVAGFAADIKDLKDSDFKRIGQSLEPIKKVADIQALLGDTQLSADWMYSTRNLGTLGQSLEEFGNHLMQFNTDTSSYSANSQNIKDAIDMLDKVYGIENELSSNSGNGIGNLTKSFKNFFTTLSDLYKGTGLFGNGASIADNASGAVTGMTEMLDSMVDSINSYQDEFESAGINLDRGLAVGLMNGKATAISAAAFVAASAYARACKVLGIHSPSEELQWVGEMFVQGFANGVTENTNIAEGVVDDMFNKALDGADQGLKKFVSIVQNGIDDNLRISPVLDLSDASNWGSQIAGMLGQQSIGVGANLAKNVATGNGTTIIQNAAGADSTQVVSAINALNERMDDMAKAISGMRLVLNTGVLVGQLAGPLDRKLGEYAARNARR